MYSLPLKFFIGVITLLRVLEGDMEM